MSDIATLWDAQNLRGDYVLAGSMLVSSQDLQTAVLISLFTDRIADPDDIIPDGSGDPRGWIGDEPGQPPIGSRLWLLAREKWAASGPVYSSLFNRATQYVTESVQWLVDDGVVQKFDILVQLPKPKMLAIKLTPYRQNGKQLPALQYSYVWDQL